MKKSNQFYLKKIKLSPYKNIPDVEVNLHEGLNIFIGKNAVGKTNFFNYLYHILKLELEDFFEVKAELFFHSDNDLYLKINSAIPEFQQDDFSELLQISNTSFEIRTSSSKYAFDHHKETIKKLEELGINFTTNFVKYGIPKVYPLIDSPFNFNIEFNKNSYDILHLASKSESHFLSNVLFKLNFLLKQCNTEQEIGNFIQDIEKGLEPLIRVLSQTTPIKNIRVNNFFTVKLDKNKHQFMVKNLFLEFKTNNYWYSFSELSDGSKRLFFMISEIISTDDILAYKRFDSIKKLNKNRVILIEEPELGIHPHLLSGFLKFLKEEAKTNQILITTHSPIVLDILDKEELDHIVIASLNEEGNAQFKPLKDHEITKAELYLNKTGFLSDYWKYSDLDN